MKVWNRKVRLDTAIVLGGVVRIEATAEIDGSEIVVNLGIVQMKRITIDSIQEIKSIVEQRLIDSFDSNYSVDKIALISVDGKSVYQVIDAVPVLHLNLLKQYFDMIQSGNKPEEYRVIKPYWEQRFKSPGYISVKGVWYPFEMVKVVFSNGYRKDRAQFEAQITGMRFNSEGKEKWGALPGQKYFVLEVKPISTN